MDACSSIGHLSILALSPERQFLHYAWPCLGNREGHGQKVLPCHSAEIGDLLATEERPRRSLLRYVFPEAYRGITRAGLCLGVDKWSHAAVEQYFLVDHNEHLAVARAHGVSQAIIALCMVYVGQIQSQEPLVCRLAYPTSGEQRILNPLGLCVSVKDTVAQHGLSIVDVLRSTVSFKQGRDHAFG